MTGRDEQSCMETYEQTFLTPSPLSSYRRYNECENVHIFSLSQSSVLSVRNMFLFIDFDLL